MEFLLRVILYMTSHVGTAYSGSVYIIIILLYTALMGWFQPFKSSLKSFMYLLYMLYLGIIAVFFLHHSIVYVKPSQEFKIIFSLIVYVAFAEFAMIVVYHIWIYWLCHIILFKKLEKHVKINFLTNWKFSHRHNQRSTSVNQDVLSTLENYCEYQDDLLMY